MVVLPSKALRATYSQSIENIRPSLNWCGGGIYTERNRKTSKEILVNGKRVIVWLCVFVWSEKMWAMVKHVYVNWYNITRNRVLSVVYSGLLWLGVSGHRTFFHPPLQPRRNLRQQPYTNNNWTNTTKPLDHWTIWPNGNNNNNKCPSGNNTALFFWTYGTWRLRSALSASKSRSCPRPRK